MITSPSPLHLPHPIHNRISCKPFRPPAWSPGCGPWSPSSSPSLSHCRSVFFPFAVTRARMCFLSTYRPACAHVCTHQSACEDAAWQQNFHPSQPATNTFAQQHPLTPQLPPQHQKQAHPARTCLLDLWASLSSSTQAAAPTPASSPDTPSGHHPHHAPLPSAASDNNNQTIDTKADDNQEHDRLAGLRYTFVTLSFLCTALLVALLVDDLSLVLELVGATGSTIVSYLLPGAAYVRLHPYPHARRTAAQLQFMVGVGVMAVGLTAVFLKA